MTRHCCVQSCKVNFDDPIALRSNLSFHCLPTRQLIREKWLSVLEKHDPKVHTRKVIAVCSRHFEKTCFNFFCNQKRLLPDAVPSIFTELTREQRLFPDKILESPEKISLNGNKDGTASLNNPLSMLMLEHQYAKSGSNVEVKGKVLSDALPELGNINQTTCNSLIVTTPQAQRNIKIAYNPHVISLPQSANNVQIKYNPYIVTLPQTNSNFQIGYNSHIVPSPQTINDVQIVHSPYITPAPVIGTSKELQQSDNNEKKDYFNEIINNNQLLSKDQELAAAFHEMVFMIKKHEEDKKLLKVTINQLNKKLELGAKNMDHYKSKVYSLMRNVQRSKKRKAEFCDLKKELKKQQELTERANLILEGTLPKDKLNINPKGKKVQLTNFWREFAMNLYSCSPKAYKFVKLNALQFLPHYVTVRKWKRKIQVNPANGQTSLEENSSLGINNSDLNDSECEEEQSLNLKS